MYWGSDWCGRFTNDVWVSSEEGNPGLCRTNHWRGRGRWHQERVQTLHHLQHHHLGAGHLLVYSRPYCPDGSLALGTAVLLSVVFAIRFVKTKKLMPAGFLGLLSALFGAVFVFALCA